MPRVGISPEATIQVLAHILVTHGPNDPYGHRSLFLAECLVAPLELLCRQDPSPRPLENVSGHSGTQGCKCTAQSGLQPSVDGYPVREKGAGKGSRMPR